MEFSSLLPYGNHVAQNHHLRSRSPKAVATASHEGWSSAGRSVCPKEIWWTDVTWGRPQGCCQSGIGKTPSLAMQDIALMKQEWWVVDDWRDRITGYVSDVLCLWHCVAGRLGYWMDFTLLVCFDTVGWTHAHAHTELKRFAPFERMTSGTSYWF